MSGILVTSLNPHQNLLSRFLPFLPFKNIKTKAELLSDLPKVARKLET